MEHLLELFILPFYHLIDNIPTYEIQNFYMVRHC